LAGGYAGWLVAAGRRSVARRHTSARALQAAGCNLALVKMQMYASGGSSLDLRLRKQLAVVLRTASWC
jgi:hypothetical protein